MTTQIDNNSALNSGDGLQEMREIDEALHADADNSSKILEAEQKRSGKLAALLRNAGTAALLGAAAVFLLQQWGDISHIGRYFSFLGFTLLISAAGFFCGIRIKEDKGARTLLAITLAVLPVHFCQLGALIYSRVSALYGIRFHGPNLLLWESPSTVATILTVVTGLALIVPLARFSFTALARRLSGSLTAIYLSQLAFLLLPTRDSNVIALLAALGVVHLLHVDSTSLRNEAAMRTKEGRIVRGILMLPVLSLVGRSVYLYAGDLTFLFGSMLFGALSVMMLVQLPRYVESKGIRAFLQYSSVCPAVISWGLLLGEFVPSVVPHTALQLFLHAFPISGILMLMAHYADPHVADKFRKTAIVVGELVATSALVFFGGLLAAFFLIAISLVSAIYGYMEKQSGTFGIGVAGFVIGLLYHLKYAVDIIGYSPWISLAVLGIATVIFSSYVERSYGEIRARVRALRGRFARESDR